MIRFFSALVLGLAVAVFAIENDQSVRLVFLGMTAPSVHLVYVLLAALVLGAGVAILLGGLRVLHLGSRVRALEVELAAARTAVQTGAREAEAAISAAVIEHRTTAAPAAAEARRAPPA